MVEFSMGIGPSLAAPSITSDPLRDQKNLFESLCMINNATALNLYTAYLKLLMEDHLQDAFLIAIKHEADRIFSSLLSFYPLLPAVDVNRLIQEACMVQERPAIHLILKTIYEHSALMANATADNLQILNRMFNKDILLR